MTEDENVFSYSPEDLYVAFEEFDSYLGTQQGLGMFELEEPLRTGLIGSGYVVAQGKEYNIKDVDLYLTNSDVLDSLKRCPGITRANSSIHVVHVEPFRGWETEVAIEIFSSLSQPLGLSTLEGPEVARSLDEELSSPESFLYEGGNLEVVLPSPETFAATKNPESGYAEKYLDQFRKVDELTGSDLVEGSEF